MRRHERGMEIRIGWQGEGGGMGIGVGREGVGIGVGSERKEGRDGNRSRKENEKK